MFVVMKRITTRMVDVVDLLISGVVGWIIREVLSYVKQIVWSRFQFNGKSYLKCFFATIILAVIDRFLSIRHVRVKLSEGKSLWFTIVMAVSVKALITAYRIPFATRLLLSKSTIFTIFKFTVWV